MSQIFFPGFLDSLNHKISLLFRLPRSCQVRLQNISALEYSQDFMRGVFEKRPSEKNKGFQQIAFNLGNLLHRNWRHGKIKDTLC